MIPVCEPYLNGNEKKYVLDCLDTNWISSKGKYIGKFEKGFAKYIGCKYGVSTTSGTTALHLALRVLGIGEGDEVIVPTLTMAAPIFAILYVGAKPVLVDCEPDTWNMDASQIEDKVTDRTRAILPVHLYGHPTDMEKVLDVALEHDLLVIEDAAEAVGTEFNEHKAGSMSHIGCFSCYGNKILTSGEGGMLVTNREDYAEQAQSLKDMAHSKSQRFSHDEVAFNYRLTNIQGAIGLAQLEKVGEYVARRRANAALYNHHLNGIEGLQLPAERGYARNSYWMYGLLAKSEKMRLKLISGLFKHGIETRPFFVPMHQQPWWDPLREVTHVGEFPVADDISCRGFYLPSGTGLKTEEIDYICQCVKGLL